MLGENVVVMLGSSALEVTLVHLCLRLHHFGDASQPWLKYDLGVF